MVKGLFVLIVILCVYNVSGFNVPSYIIDVDTGVDDYQALTFMLNAKARGWVDIAAIVLTDGNAKLNDVKNNTARLLQIVQEHNIPLYAGSSSRILRDRMPDHWFGFDGFGDLHLPKPPLKLEEDIAPVAIAEMVRKRPGSINYLALGPMTNLALAMNMFEHVSRSIGNIYAMGGNYGEDTAEFNFLNDPEAAHIVLKRASRNVTLFTYQACSHEDMTYRWRFSLKHDNPVWNLVDSAEKKLFGKLDPLDMYNSCDPITVAILVDPRIGGDFINVKASVALDDANLAKVIVDETPGAHPNVNLILNYNVPAYKNYFNFEFEDVCVLHDCKALF